MTDTRPANPNAMFHIPGANHDTQSAAALNAAPTPVMSPMEMPVASPIREGNDPSIDTVTRQDEINVLNAGYNMPARGEAPAVDHEAQRAAIIAESTAELAALYAAPAAAPAPRVEKSSVAKPIQPEQSPYAEQVVESAPNLVSGPEAAARATVYGQRIMQLNRQPVLTQYGENLN